MNKRTYIKRVLRLALLLVVIPVLCGVSARAQQMSALVEQFIVEDSTEESDFPIVAKDSSVARFIFDESDHKGVIRAVGDLRSDVERVTGLRPQIASEDESGLPLLVIGTIGNSDVIDRLVVDNRLDVSDIKGKWESFVIATIPARNSQERTSLVVAGSDKRGTIYGIYEISQQLGVSPWHWWADVPARQRVSAFVKSGRYVSDEPKVRYRGIFINDEAPAMTGWAGSKFGGMNSRMYSHMFELLLRLRANYLWPAMWGNAFNEDDPENPRLADEYGIIMGTSHHEPMMRSHKEWTKRSEEYGNGEWNYKTNAEGLRRFWEEGLERNKDYEQIVTMALRGDGDIPMDDAGGAEENFSLLEKIMRDQRGIIEKVTQKPASETPQVWALYSEVLEYYDQGVDVPDDIIVLLCDENWGNVRRLPELDGPRHPGGYGIYYHVDLHGAPRAYKWLNMTQIPHMWEQLQLSYSYGVDKIWILNVGDLKPNEYPMDFFLKMAWNPSGFTQDNLDDYAIDFCAEKFGEKNARQAAEILSKYCKYNSRVTAEMLDHRTYNLESGEFLKVRDSYLALEALGMRQYHALEERYRDAYMQLILHPVRAMANLYDMYYSVAMNRKLATEKDLRANYWADRVESCFARDAYLANDYHFNVSDGKWNHIMDTIHIGYTTWREPNEGNIIPEVVRVDPDEARASGYVFKEGLGVVSMEAEHFYSKMDPKAANWTVIPDLGRTLSGIALMPYTEATEGASISYRMILNDQRKEAKVRFFLDSTLPFKKGGHRIAASFDGGPETILNINADLNWENNYSKMYPAGAARMIEISMVLELPDRSDRMQDLIFRPLDPGIVLHKVVVDMGGYIETRLKMPESSYAR